MQFAGWVRRQRDRLVLRLPARPGGGTSVVEKDDSDDGDEITGFGSPYREFLKLERGGFVGVWQPR